MKDYYELNHQGYFERTFHIDPASFLKPFADRLPSGATVLDVGCGSGRDLLWLKNRGFAGTGFERSPGLAALAVTNTGCPMIAGDFTEFDFSGLAFDALLLCGSLVHLSHEQLPEVLDKVIRALNTPGWVFLSLKSGRGCRTDELERTFYLWQADDLERILKEREFEILDFTRSASAAGTGESWLGYVLAYGQQAEGRRLKAEVVRTRRPDTSGRRPARPLNLKTLAHPHLSKLYLNILAWEPDIVATCTT